MSPSPLSPAELQHLLRQPAQRHAPLVIDVRPLRQYSRGHIPGSQHLSRALLLSSELPDQDLVLITEDDQRAEELGAALHQRGYHRQIRSLHGGLSAWTQAGHPLQQAPACNTSSGFASRALAPLGLPPLGSGRFQAAQRLAPDLGHQSQNLGPSQQYPLAEDVQSSNGKNWR
ncbi:MAG: rhodanese-like domain-containing protein [Synechococcaceae cyanobacterium]